jgi:hypothetical protein
MLDQIPRNAIMLNDSRRIRVQQCSLLKRAQDVIKVATRLKHEHQLSDIIKPLRFPPNGR